ncbi:ATP-binding cassette domain-containing protein [Roseibacillus ishigakijimensis]|uniref:ABC transporter ATP-binding protein n=1 Tax=Roseibacillus ishigakijimensis TaxID=454146 RepID=A0A934RLI3_9BACT|nr:ABC transporter ATP-binding protein [Roseibacillus ishigakijimensis]MBK1833947.1 ABC transporter ATP-binding protein [Roseibacillus ishigakijimensis]
MARVELCEVWKRFGKQDVLSGVNWQGTEGELVALMGVNGAGKTTMLRVLAGLVGPESGEVRIDGQRFTREDLALRRQLYFLGDEPALFPEENALVNLATMARLWQVFRRGLEEEAAEWMERFGILALREKPVAQLSRGQRYKVALVILATLRPPIWLLDEPFASGMDAQGLRTLRQLIREGLAEGALVVFSTQLIEMVRDFAPRVTVVAGGVVLHDGAVPELEEKARAGDPHLRNLMDF